MFYILLLEDFSSWICHMPNIMVAFDDDVRFGYYILGDSYNFYFLKSVI